MNLILKRVKQIRFQPITTLFVLSIFLLGKVSCHDGIHDASRQPIVTVGNYVLTHGELQTAIPANVSEHDSVMIAEDYISRWVKGRLMLRQAEINLSSEEKNVEKLLEDYRVSLLVHMFQQKILEKKHAPTVVASEIEEYYERMRDNFTLHENIIQGVFLKVPLEAPNQDALVQWLRGGVIADLVSLEAYSFQYARKYEQFLESWIPFSRINFSLAEPIVNEERFLRQSRFYQTTDSVYNYYLAVSDYKSAGGIAPLSYVEDRIKAILLNQKRIEFLQQLSQELYDEALRDKIVTFH